MFVYNSVPKTGVLTFTRLTSVIVSDGFTPYVAR